MEESVGAFCDESKWLILGFKTIIHSKLIEIQCIFYMESYNERVNDEMMRVFCAKSVLVTERTIDEIGLRAGQKKPMSIESECTPSALYFYA